MKVRIGIDVGGTFTDAVVIDNDSYELIGYMKIPTTHNADGGVADGIVSIINSVMEKYNIAPEDVKFIAHGTTQATNALLEGDVVKVGIACMGKGVEGMKASSDTQIGDIELAPNKFLRTSHAYINLGKGEKMEDAVRGLVEDGSKVIVASAAFAVDDPSVELELMQEASKQNIPSTGSHEISKLYGLRTRTRTAAINASILPKMIETANMTEISVKRAGIKAPLMIMRCDGGVMDINEVRQRPILTMLSGPAAGVAGALMYEKVSHGLFLEVGGTSTDISAIKNGKVMVEYAEVGGHKTYLNSLDVRTVGIAGGSMVRLGDKGVIDVGPRSAHIAGFEYSVYVKPEDIQNPEIMMIAPSKDDPSDYAVIKCDSGKKYCITVSCAANILGYVSEKDYAHGNVEAARSAFEPFARKYGITIEEFAKQIMDKASEKNKVVVEALLKDYEMELKHTVLVGGGGGSAAIVPYLAKYMGMEYKISKNAEVISPIGVSLAMVRDVVERTIANPTDEDILRVRREAEQAAIRSGAAPGTIEIQMEVDSSKNIVRATATAATELRTKNLNDKKLKVEEIISIAASSMQVPSANISTLADTSELFVLSGETITSKLFGILKKKTSHIRVVDNEGIIRIQKNNGKARKISLKRFEEDLERIIQDSTTYSDAGEEIPDVYVFIGKKIVDLSGLISKEQIIKIAKVEVGGLDNSAQIVGLACSKG
jgi:N-methylhydantoinase A/oxoprolinase/acetone carboxylase beta subunit